MLIRAGILFLPVCLQVAFLGFFFEKIQSYFVLPNLFLLKR